MALWWPKGIYFSSSHLQRLSFWFENFFCSVDDFMPFISLAVLQKCFKFFYSWTCCSTSHQTFFFSDYRKHSGIKDCNDESDEKHCRCASPLKQFDCTAGSAAISRPAECISRELICNGISNCYGGRDEERQVRVILNSSVLNLLVCAANVFVRHNMPEMVRIPNF